MHEDSDFITDTAGLLRHYGTGNEASLAKEVDFIHPHYRAFIAASPFVILATVGAEGMDASPRGDAAGFVRVADERTLMIPDRAGNNRVDTLHNIVRDPRVGLLFLIPGIGESLRVNGTARIAIAPDLRASFTMQGKPARSVLVVSVTAVYFQCPRAAVRAGLWAAEKFLPRSALPSSGTILGDLSRDRIDRHEWDRTREETVRNTLY